MFRGNFCCPFVDGPIILNLNVTEVFAKTELAGNELRESIIDKCDLLSEYHEKLVARHESIM